jgi:drug/metabolite transporter (DMT)-like permease
MAECLMAGARFWHSLEITASRRLILQRDHPIVSTEASSVPRTDIARGILLMLLQAFLFAAMDALVKLATERHPTGQIVFFRNLFALIPVFFFVRQAGGISILRTRRLGQHIIRSLGGVASMVALFLAYSYMPLADAMAISTSGPIFLTALSVPLLGEHVGWRRWGAVIVGFIGILIITRPGSGVFGLAALLPLGGAFFYAIAMVQIRKLSSTEPPARIVFYFTIAAMLLGAISLPWQWVTPTPLSLVYLIGIGLVGGIAQMIMTHAFRLAPVSVVGPFDYTGLIFGAAFGYAIWQQVPDRFVWLGAAVIIASGIYILHRETVRRRQVQPAA